MDTAGAHGLLVRLLRQIAPDVDVAAIDPDALFQEAFDLDSIDFLHLVDGLAEAAGIEIPERDYPLLSSVNGVCSYLGCP